MNKNSQKGYNNRAAISLGSNINKEVNLPKAVAILAEKCGVIAVSSVYETLPVGLKEQPIFWNAAALIHTELSAQQLKKNVLDHIERKLGRVRTADKNAPRTIDADLTLAIQGSPIEGRQMKIFDPDFTRFVHVAVPIAELLPQERLPDTGKTFKMIAEELLRSQEKGLKSVPRAVTGVNLLKLVENY